jgi:hypothetical protein
MGNTHKGPAPETDILEAHDDAADQRIGPENHQAQNKWQYEYKGRHLLRIKELFKLLHIQCSP